MAMKCPVCKTECHSEPVCPECGFDDISPVFLSKEDGEAWLHTVVEQYRTEYWKALSDYEISDKTVVSYHGNEETILIPYGIESIGESAFCKNKYIRHVYLPDTVKQIESHAFSTTDMVSVVFPEGLEKIGPFAFEFTNIRNITVPGTCKVICDRAFHYCRDLKSVIITQGVRTLEEHVFEHCRELEVISIPESLTDIGEAALATVCPRTRISIAPGNKRYQFLDNCLVDKNAKTIVAGFLSDDGDIKIPITCGVTAIGTRAFQWQSTASVINIPDGIKEIGSFAFSYCDKMRIVIPQSVEKVGYCLFDGSECDIFCEAEYLPCFWDDDWIDDVLIHAPKKVYWRDEWNNNPDMPMPVRQSPNDCMSIRKLIEEKFDKLPF